MVTADVDGLKVANDHYGHSMGDRLIAAVASTIAAATPSSEHALVARIGGDEFGILLPGELAARTDEVGAAIRAELQSSSALDGVVAVRASIGWAVAQSGASLSTAFREADRSVNTEKIRTGARRM